MRSKKTRERLTEEKGARVYRTLDELNLIDNFLFNEVVAGEEGEWFCRYFLKLLLGRDVGEIRVSSQEIVQGTDTGTHGIRMDLYVDEAGGALYDFEPDKYTNGDELPRRARFYHALTDSKRLESGVDYGELRNLWIVFILPFDPFGAGRARYTARMGFEELPGFPYDDGLRVVYLNTKGSQEEDGSLVQFLRYMQRSTEENVVTAELKHLDGYVRRIKKKREVGVKYMRLWELENMIRKEAREEGLAEGREEGLAEGRKEGFVEGREEGREEGLAESILILLKEKGSVSADLEHHIREERNPDILHSWIRIAVKAESAEEFQKGIEGR